MSWKDDLNYGLAAFGIQLPAGGALDEWKAKLGSRPARNALATVAGSAILFHHFERGRNPRVRDLADAMLYCAACVNAGEPALQPVTRAGKLLCTLLMTHGPALADRLPDSPPSAGVQDEMLATLRAILARLDAAAAAGTAR